MRKHIIVLTMSLLCLAGCSNAPEESITTSPYETTQLAYAEDYVDTAFGVPCKYVDGETETGELSCAKKIVQEDWKVPADGWDMQSKDGLIYIEQVYSGDILLLPLNYGANTYRIIGLDATESDVECSTCPDKNDGGADIIN